MPSDINNSAVLGLYISPQSIYAVQGYLVNNSIKVIAQGTLATPDRAILGETIEDPQRLGIAIRQLLRDAGIRARSAMVALSAGSYMMRSLRLPEAPEAEQRALVRGGLEEAEALPLRAGVFGFLWLPPADGEDRRLADVSAYYTEDVQIDRIRETLRVAGLQMEGVEPASLAAIWAYLTLTQQKAPLALLYPAEKYSDLCIHDGQRIRHVRRIAAGWSEILADKTTQDEPPRAFLGDPELSADSSFDANIPAKEEKTASLEFLAAEVSRSLAFYARQNPKEETPQALVLLGPIKATSRLRGPIAGSIAIPVDERDPLAAFFRPTDPLFDAANNVPDRVLAAIGVTLVGKNRAYPRVDLSRQEKEAAARHRMPGLLISGVSGSMIWMLLAAVASIYLTLIEYDMRSRLANIPKEIEALQQQKATLLHSQEVNVAAHEAQSKHALPAREVMGRVAAASTPGVSLIRLHIDHRGKVTVEGKAQDTHSMQAFAVTLGQGQAVQTPQFEVFRQDLKEGLIFRLVGTCRAPTKE